MSETVIQTTNYPVEVINLPSKGLVYPKSNPLSSGQVSIRPMTSKEEDILSDANLLKKGLAIDQLFKELLVGDAKLEDMITGDKDALMIAIRIYAYGSKYNPKIHSCAKCKEEDLETLIDLTTFEYKEIDETLYNNENRFDFVLPVAKKKITFQLQTHKIEKDIEKELKFQKDYDKKSGKKDVTSKELTTRLRYIITSVDGSSELKVIRDLSENMLSRDSLAFKDYYNSIAPGVDTKFTFECPECGGKTVMAMPLTVDFFWPNSRI